MPPRQEPGVYVSRNHNVSLGNAFIVIYGFLCATSKIGIEREIILQKEYIRTVVRRGEAKKQGSARSRITSYM